MPAILLKIGSYGQIRAAHILPETVISLQGVLVILAFIAVELHALIGGFRRWG